MGNSEPRRRRGEEDYKGDGAGDEVDVSAFGVKVGARGRDAALVLMFVAIVGFLAAAGWVHHQEMDSQNRHISQQLSEMIYVMSLPQDKREALNLSMPDSLRAKLRERGRDER